jgi:flagellar hook-basal body complex protein FliE
MTTVNPIAAIAPIAVQGPLQAGNVTGVAGADAATAVGATNGTSSAGFGDALASAIDGLGAAQANADALAVQAATGDLQAVHQYLAASTEAQLLTQATVAFRDRAVEAFNEIMRMGI